MKRVKILAISLFVLGQTLSGGASAAPVTLAGMNVDFSFDDALLGLFGTPGVAGNTLFFTPTSFDALSAGGAGSGFDLTKQTINVRVTARDGFNFDSVKLAERGDYLLLGTGATVDVGGQLRVFDLAMPAHDRTAAILPAAPLTMTGFPTQNWSANAMVNVADWTGAKSLNVTLENILVASSVPGSLGFVEKKFAGLDIAVTPVPEPEVTAMLLAGLGLVGFMVSRRRSAAAV
ncbi:MAG: PEP-CTERM sorting domain-containing protein [Thiobacillus sp.]|nr:PEP-CTERM sorting domain-containing protein [Thiobacillus sp.]